MNRCYPSLCCRACPEYPRWLDDFACCTVGRGYLSREVHNGTDAARFRCSFYQAAQHSWQRTVYGPLNSRCVRANVAGKGAEEIGRQDTGCFVDQVCVHGLIVRLLLM